MTAIIIYAVVIVLLVSAIIALMFVVKKVKHVKPIFLISMIAAFVACIFVIYCMKTQFDKKPVKQYQIEDSTGTHDAWIRTYFDVISQDGQTYTIQEKQ